MAAGRYQQLLGLPPDAPAPDYYQLLGIERGQIDQDRMQATVAERLNHLQSAGPDQREAVEYFRRELQRARAILSDPISRAQYEVRQKQQHLADLKQYVKGMLADGALSSAGAEAIINRMAALGMDGHEVMEAVNKELENLQASHADDGGPDEEAVKNADERLIGIMAEIADRQIDDAIRGPVGARARHAPPSPSQQPQRPSEGFGGQAPPPVPPSLSRPTPHPWEASPSPIAKQTPPQPVSMSLSQGRSMLTPPAPPPTPPPAEHGVTTLIREAGLAPESALPSEPFDQAQGRTAAAALDGAMEAAAPSAPAEDQSGEIAELKEKISTLEHTKELLSKQVGLTAPGRTAGLRRSRGLAVLVAVTLAFIGGAMLAAYLPDYVLKLDAATAALRGGMAEHTGVILLAAAAVLLGVAFWLAGVSGKGFMLAAGASALAALLAGAMPTGYWHRVGIEKAELNKRIGTLPGEIDKARNEAKAASDSFKARERENDAKIGGLNGEIEKLNGEITGLNRKLADKDNEIRKATGERDEARGMVEEQVTLKKQIKEMEQKLAERDEEIKKVDSLRKELRDLTERFDALNKQLEKRRKEIEALQKENDELRKKSGR